MDYVKITDIHPAEYNPRKLSDAAFVELQGSPKTLGFILPIIINKDNMTIIAGHQRTKAATKVGIEEVPCFYVHGVELQDEMLFNLIHNGVEHEPETLGTFKGSLAPAQFYTEIPNKDFDLPQCQPTLVKDMCGLIMRYQDALCAIICGNEVVFGNNYVYACQRLDIPVHAYVLEEEKRGIFDYYFKQDYGVFCYDALDCPEFQQGLAQPPRHAAIDWSILYRQVVKWLLEEDKGINILDFGCGKAMCIDKVRMQHNYRNAIGLEFFNHNRVGISVEKGHQMIDKFFEHYQKHGKFDYVICDAVINSVVSQFAEDNVLTCLNLFCKMGGKVFFSGRMRANVEKLIDAKRCTTDGGLSVRFLDDNGLTAYILQGQWFFQKFLRKEQYEALPEKFGLEPFVTYEKSGYFGFGCTKVRELPVERYREALIYEFNMQLPNKVRYGRHQDALKVFGFDPATDEEVADISKRK